MSPLLASLRRSGPSGSDTDRPVRPPATSVTSSEPPPRSPTSPSASGIPEMTPSAASRASSSPDSTTISAGKRARMRSTSSGPLDASRTAEVASTATCGAPNEAARRTNRARQSISGATRLSSSRPVAPTPRPSSQKTRSLTTGTGTRPSRSNTTRRTVLEPRSITANGASEPLVAMLSPCLATQPYVVRESAARNIIPCGGMVAVGPRQRCSRKKSWAENPSGGEVARA